MSEENKNESTDARDQEISENVDRALKSFVDIGRLWASHGLSVGRSALETSAHTLRTTAELLGDISEKLAHKTKREAA
jgi:hypothetical protein